MFKNRKDKDTKKGRKEDLPGTISSFCVLLFLQSSVVKRWSSP